MNYVYGLLVLAIWYLSGVYWGPIWVKPWFIKELEWKRWFPFWFTKIFIDKDYAGDPFDPENFDWIFYIQLWIATAFMRLVVAALAVLTIKLFLDRFVF